LGDRWPLKTEDKNLPSGILTFLDDGLMPTVKDLLTLMTIISDNTATDIVIKRLGKDAINERMRSFGLNDIHIQMTVRELFEELLPNADPTQDLYQLEIDAEKRFDENRESFRNNRVFRLTPENNVTTPRDMTDLLCHIFAGHTPDRQWSDAALNILLQQQLNERLPRFLPAGTRIAHKTGTLFSIRNDAGIIYAGEDSHVAVSVFVLWDEESVEDDHKANWARRFAIDTAMGEIGLLACQAYQ
jgi:beta-lactamase class A